MQFKAIPACDRYDIIVYFSYSLLCYDSILPCFSLPDLSFYNVLYFK